MLYKNLINMTLTAEPTKKQLLNQQQNIKIAYPQVLLFSKRKRREKTPCILVLILILIFCLCYYIIYILINTLIFIILFLRLLHRMKLSSLSDLIGIQGYGQYGGLQMIPLDNFIVLEGMLSSVMVGEIITVHFIYSWGYLYDRWE